jgi:heme/copper-type cytochrome/quinol oxidase subunit 2
MEIGTFNYEDIFVFIFGLMSVLIVIFSIYLRKRFFKREKDKTITIKMENGTKYEIPLDLPEGDFKKLLIKLKSLENIDAKKAKKNNEAGLVSIDILVTIVPAIIAILFTVTYIYLLIANKGNIDYNPPKELTYAMTTILGYYFGVGVTSATTKGKPLSKDEINELINKHQ